MEYLLLPIAFTLLLLLLAVVVAIAVHKHRQLRRSIEESEARLRTLIDTLPMEFWSMDADLRYVLQNAMSTRNYGSVVGKSIEEIGLPEDVARQWIEQDRRVLAGETLRDVYTQQREGETRYYENIVAPVYLDGKAVGIVGAGLDITDRRRVEEELRQRTAELEAVNRELEAFSYSVSHDLRAPLRAIGGFAQMIREDFGNLLPKQHELLASIGRNVGHMNALIDDILNFSRITRAELQTRTVDLESMVRQVFDEVRAVVPERKIDLRLGPLPPAQCDPAMMRQVLVNLLSNAVKYSSPREEAVIGVEAESTGDGTFYRVRDNGVGFDMKDGHRLFELFQRLDNGRFEGTGVGLAIVARLIERHGGRVAAEGTPDEGACFSFWLPGQPRTDSRP